MRGLKLLQVTRINDAQQQLYGVALRPLGIMLEIALEGRRRLRELVPGIQQPGDIQLVLAREALMAGGTAPTILNAANEIAVAAFLTERLGFLEIARVVEETLGKIAVTPVADLADVGAADAEARAKARELAGLPALGDSRLSLVQG